jgi:CYTH domain-containing protein
MNSNINFYSYICIVLPHFIGEEVTGDRRYYNSQLRRCPYATWKG